MKEEGVLLLHKRKRALISVSDKTGVAALAHSLIGLGWEIVSTGGTAQSLRDAGLSVTSVDEVTGFPEILGGRVKTLNPMIHAGILARFDLEEQRLELERHGISPIELVVVNLYPFARTIAREGVRHAEAVENIDVGGPTMLRAAAKNYAHVTVVVNPNRYPEVIAELEQNGLISLETRCRLAAEAFAHTAEYDAVIAGYFAALPEAGMGLYPAQLSFAFNKVQDLRYGENPQQDAAFYAASGAPSGLAAARKLQGKEISFNNLNDLNAAWDMVREFELPTVVAVKHANPCGVGSAPTVEEAYTLAYDADPVSIFGGVLAVNRVVDGKTARAMSKIF
ncbi:MAG TPA: bifunctional phosphoribosylaminoimidazolecarboxamide formyltransferase/IMP cyclohydrolase, partial [Candidatus Limnocylindrales bacterium]|nr:bifunctional phosphoribosylaminoimidazolecarboxamide formyltransferase/IMP cyclohydrolase [Candidatus Limnocylindrales bacterium]